MWHKEDSPSRSAVPHPTEQSASTNKITESLPFDENENEIEASEASSVLIPPTVRTRKSKIWRDLGNVSEETSHTKFYKRNREKNEFEVTTREEYLSISESMSGSSDTFECIHGPHGKEYTQEGLLKRNLMKNLDPIPKDPKWIADCPPSFGWDMADTLYRMVRCPTVEKQMERLLEHLNDFVKISSKGYRVDVLEKVCTIVSYLLESVSRFPFLKPGLVSLLENLKHPIFLIKSSDVVTHFDMIMHFIGYIGFLLIHMDDDVLFDVVAGALIWHLSAPDKLRGQGTVQLRHTLAAAAPVLRQTTVRMMAIANSRKFPIFLEISILLACDTAENCIEMMKENILENIFYRFNPYFPYRHLESYDINPVDCHDPTVKLGESSVNMTTTLTILLVLVKTTKEYLDKHPKFKSQLPCPDCYAQRCFIWAYRYECRAREHRHERITLTVIAAVLNKIYGERLLLFSSILMGDIISLSVLTELPPRKDWTATVNFTTKQQDVQFKKILIFFVVDLLKTFPYNKFMMQSRYWLLGIIYLLDPGLCHLRAHWSPPLFAELRKTALQALVCAIPMCDPKWVRDYGLIRRIMWYIEWYSESPYEISVLYWCVRLLQVATYHTRKPERDLAIQDLYDTHGIVIIIHLCRTLMEQKLPPVERSQAVLALSLRMLTSSAHMKKTVTCCVYPNIKWPNSINSLARKMIDVVLYSLDKHYIVSDRERFVRNDGIYKLLDIITMTRPAVQCIALAVVCDIARAGDAVGQLVSWRANLGASNAYPNVVQRGATIASLLASVFREGCHSLGVKLNEYGIIEELDHPIMSEDVRNELKNTDEFYAVNHSPLLCFAAEDMAGSCMSKAFALLHMLSEDLNDRVKLADEAYNLYKNIKLAVEDEVILVLCSHYLTLKLNEVWMETKVQCGKMFKPDSVVVDDFLAEREKECSLYAFLGRIRLNIALDALRTVRCVARSTDHSRIRHAMLHDAVFAYHRQSLSVKNNILSLLRTYKAPLDDQNITGQNIKVSSIRPKNRWNSLELDMEEEKAD
ncbi:hypothetical protein SFRURICE_016553 [Spodoptera frugiperda]|nr:hypothetical protein SFRURICE_016553 [Spodoptera frugiperda]